MISIALAAAVAAPPAATSPLKRPDVRGIFRADDYPAEAVSAHQEGAVIARMIVDPTGRIESCTVVYSSKSKALDHATCNILRSRAVFSPARDEHDVPIYTVVISPPITWRLFDGPGVWVGYHVVRKPDVELQISGAPAGVTLPLDFSIDYEVKADGTLAWCRPWPDVKVPTAFAKVACDRSNMPAFQPLTSKNGQAVDALYSANYRFRLDHGQNKSGGAFRHRRSNA